jgi:glycosyltransferase involved in cell wall biosynthesis
MPIRILIYSHSFAPQVGGLETMVMSLAKALAVLNGTNRSGTLDVAVVTPTPQDGFDDAALPFRMVRRPGLLRLARLLHAADIVHVAGPCLTPIVLGLLLGRHVVVEHHGFQTICPNGQLLQEPGRNPCPGRFMEGRHRDCLRCNASYGWRASLKLWCLTFARRWLCARVAVNITPTRWLSTALKLPRMTTIHHGVPANGNGKPCGDWASPPAIAFMGRLVTTKGVRILLRAAERLKAKGVSFKLRIVGDGPERDGLQAQTRALGLAGEVSFLGYRPAEELGEALAGVRAVALPSLGGEVFGLVAAESMMRGMLPIVSDGGALAEVVGDAGLTFPPGDAEALADCLQRVLESPEFTISGAIRAQLRASSSFTLSRMAGEHAAVYQALLAQGAGRC